MSVQINVHTTNGLSIDEINKFWCETLELPLSCLRKPMINKYSKISKKTKKGKLPYGTCKIRIGSTEIVNRIYGAIGKYASFKIEEFIEGA